nr:ABC transporter substrate-binding protein [uncultured Brumimicrobium sp.]
MNKKSSLFTLFYGVLLFVGLSSCKAETKKEFAEVGSLISKDTLENEFAEAFQIVYHNNFTEILILDPTTKEVIQNYKIGKEEQGLYNSFTHNIERVVAMSTTQIGMMRKLAVDDKICGVSGFKYLCHPMSQANVVEVGDMGSADAESFMSANPDVVLYSGFNLHAPILSKLEQANLKTFLIYEWKETHPLGRAEWIKVFGVLFQKEQEANSIYDEIKKQYFDIQEKLSQEEKGASAFSGTYYGDVFNVPAGDSYMAQLFKDANINYIYSETSGTGSLMLSLERLITDNKDTEVWLNPSASTKTELLNQSEKFKLMKAVKTGKIYSYTQKTNCFWENSPIEPHKVLEDLGKIFHPLLFEDRTLNYYSLVTDE